VDLDQFEKTAGRSEGRGVQNPGTTRGHGSTVSVASLVPGLQALHSRTRGDPAIKLAVLDGPVDHSHPCFAGAKLEMLATMASTGAGAGRMSRHGTHVASLLFGQPGTPVEGVAPACTGVVVPIFRETEGDHLPQLDLARTLEQALAAGAHVVNISGGEPASAAEADPMLARALRACEEQNVLVVAATGNDGCECLHVPAALPTVLAVGAQGRDGGPLPSSNRGAEYRSHGVLAPGQSIEGAEPGGGTCRMSGTSFATPIVAGVAALLLSLQRAEHGRVDPAAVRRALIESARPCAPHASGDDLGCLGGILDVAAAAHRVLSDPAPDDGPRAAPASTYTGVRAAGLEPDGEDAPEQSQAPDQGGDATVSDEVSATPESPPPLQAETPAAMVPSAPPPAAPPVEHSSAAPSGVTPACADDDTGGVRSAGGCGCGGVRASDDATVADAAKAVAATTAAATVVAAATPSYVFALGTVGFDFGTEARRDTFRQLMPDVLLEGSSPVVSVAANPYDVMQLAAYLNNQPYESTKLIWTLNLDMTPIYALEAEVSYPEEVYRVFRHALEKQVLPETDETHVARVSIPGVLSNRTVRLFSGQVLPVVVVQPRGLFEWNVGRLIEEVLNSVKSRPEIVDRPDFDEERVRRLVRIFLEKVYFECRNLGAAPADRALNFAATNAFQAASGIAQGLVSGEIIPTAGNSLYHLDSIEVRRSPYCRLDSDCWDVLISWFDPENERRARSIYQFTIDVSDELPVSLAPAHQYLAT
jgi:cyanobactin maturation PatA/PatG family protease